MVGLAGVTEMEVKVAPALSGRSTSIPPRKKKIRLRITPADVIRFFMTLPHFYEGCIETGSK
jgi:hypothetical protein